MRVALFGTSADPPTSGHQKILSWLSERYDWVAIWAADNPFKSHQTSLTHAPKFPHLELPKPWQTGDPKQWEQFIHRSANFFYHCAAVKSVEIKNRGMYIRPWEIYIHADNNPRWLKPYLEELTKKIRKRNQKGGYDTPYRIIMTGASFEEVI